MAYVVMKLNKIKLAELCSDNEIYSWAELGRRAGLSDVTLPNAFRNQDACVSMETAMRIADALGTKMVNIGNKVIKNKTTSATNDFKNPVEKAVKMPEKTPAVEECGSTTLQNQLILRELKLHTEILNKLVQQWS